MALYYGTEISALTLMAQLHIHENKLVKLLIVKAMQQTGVNLRGLR